MGANVASGRKQRKTSPRTTTKRVTNGPRLKELWADPEWRAALLEKRKAGLAKARAEGRGTRMGVPDGMRKAEAEALWARASEQADKFIRIMKDNDELPEIVIPGSEAEMAEKALHEAYKHAVGPLTDTKTKASLLRLVLDFTKSKPESKSKLTLDKSEEWLSALDADMKNDDRSAE